METCTKSYYVQSAFNLFNLSDKHHAEGVIFRKNNKYKRTFFIFRKVRGLPTHPTQKLKAFVMVIGRYTVDEAKPTKPSAGQGREKARKKELSDGYCNFFHFYSTRQRERSAFVSLVLH